MPWPLRMITYAGIILLILLVYFGYRYFRSLRVLGMRPVWLYRAIFFIPAGMFLIYPLAGHLHYWLRGSFSRTGYPDMVIYLFWYGLVCMGVMLNWLLLHDISRPVVAGISGRDKQNLKSLFARAFLLIAGITVIYTAGKMIYDTNRIVVDEITYTPYVTGSPEGNIESPLLNRPLTIVHITDLHADPYTGAGKMSRYIKKVNDAVPDIVIFTGDLISSGRDFIIAGADALAEIESTYGTFFVMGDHDYWVDTAEIALELEKRGINVLQNQNAIIRHDETLIKITGITEIYSSRIDYKLLDELLKEKAGVDLHLLASHQATEGIIRKAARSGVNQLLAGHTHGGQIRVPLFFYPVTAARVESPYVKGSWEIGGMLLNINSGLGFTLTPVRYNAPANVSVIRVR